MIGIDTKINDKKIIGKIVLCDLQKEIYPKRKDILGLIKKSGYPELILKKKLISKNFILINLTIKKFLFLFLKILYAVRFLLRQVLLFLMIFNF